MTVDVATAGQRALFSDGFWSPSVAEFRERAASVIEESLTPLLEEAEQRRRFPRRALAALGEAGLIRERWTGGPHGDAGRAVVLAEELGRAALGGIGIGVSLHTDAVLSVLMRFGRTDHLRRYAREALDGTMIGCFAASEDGGGSDLAHLATTATRTAGGWHVRGTKAFASLGAVADFALVLCRVVDPDLGDEHVGPHASRSIPPPQVIVCVPRAGFEVARRLRPVGARSLETVRIDIDAEVPGDAIVGRPGLGLFVATWGLTHERLAAAAQVVGGADLALRVTTTHLHRRRQFGAPLIEHQALRMRLSELAAESSVGRLALYSVAASLTSLRPEWVREVAGLKVVLARLGERMASECMHLFGGVGFMEDETPLSRWWRDVRVGRLGGGSDEMMLEIVATGLPIDDPLYDRLIGARG